MKEVPYDIEFRDFDKYDLHNKMIKKSFIGLIKILVQNRVLYLLH